jgi:hypothetical protein
MRVSRVLFGRVFDENKEAAPVGMPNATSSCAASHLSLQHRADVGLSATTLPIPSHTHAAQQLHNAHSSISYPPRHHQLCHHGSCLVPCRVHWAARAAAVCWSRSNHFSPSLIALPYSASTPSSTPDGHLRSTCTPSTEGRISSLWPYSSL